MLIEGTVREFLAALASADPTPGGGSASALASAMGASLLAMVAGLPKTRSGSDEDRAALGAVAAVLADVRQGLADAIDADTAAYDRVVSAYKLPKASEAEQAARKAAVQRGLRAATDVPLTVMQLSALALAQAPVVARHGHKAALSDAGVAVALLGAGLRGAGLNVEINLGGLTDEVYVGTARAESARLTMEGERDRLAANAALAGA